MEPNAVNYLTLPIGSAMPERVNAVIEVPAGNVKNGPTSADGRGRDGRTG
jgi:hypothetical protein